MGTVVEEVVPFYEKARVPTQDILKMAQTILQLYNKMQDLMKTNVKRRNSGSTLNRINEFKDNLGRTMTFWPKDAIAKIKNEEDKVFFT